MVSTIINLSNPPNNTSNTEWENTIEKVKVNPGDMVQLKYAFLDSRGSDPTNITISEPIQVETEFVIWMDNGLKDNKLIRGFGQPGGYFDEGSFYGTYSIARQYTNPPAPDDAYNVDPAKPGPVLGDIARIPVNFTIKAGVYTPNQLAEIMSREFQLVSKKKFSDYKSQLNKTLIPSDTGDAGDPLYLFCGFDSVLGTISGTQTYVLDPGAYIGATQVAVVYDEEGDGKFKFQWMHTPNYDKDNNIVVNVNAIQYSNSERDSIVSDSRMGLLATKLEPASLWEDIMGFDRDYIVCTVTNDLITYPSKKYDTRLTNFDNCRTGMLVTDDTMYEPQDKGVYFPSTYNKIVENTKPLLAINNYSSGDPTPFYLVEVTCNLSGGSFHDDDNTIKKHIIGIAPRNWTQDGFITAYSDSSLSIVHNALESTYLTNFYVRLLNPTTKEPANDLGANNTVFLEVIRGSK